jgi:predicted DNA-binding transcriptional regulator YafY
MIHEYLATGSENAITGRELCDRTGLTMRELTQAIEKERREGVPICANTGVNPGYYLAANQREMQLYCDSLSRRASEIYKTREACAETIEMLPVEA